MSARVRVLRQAGPGFVAVPNDFARVGGELDAYTFRLLVFLAAEAEGRLVHSTDVAARFGWSVNTYKRCLAAAEAAGYVRRTATGERDRYGKQVVDLLVSLSGLAPALSADDSAHCHEMTTKKISQEDQFSISLDVPSSASGRRRQVERHASPLPDDWAPNHTHKVTARQLGLDLTDLVAQFRRTCAAQESRSDWDKTFGAYLHAVNSGCDESTFPTSDDDAELADWITE